MLVVIGGHSRNIGKTSVICNVVSALRRRNWTAIKITQYGDGVCSRDGEACECADPVHPVAISEENGSSPFSDSGRFLASGASRAFWVRTPAGSLNEAMAQVRRLLGFSDNVIIESNSILRFLKPDLCGMVVDGSVRDFKPTSLRFLDRADALVATSDTPLSWPEVSPALLATKPIIAAFAPGYAADGLAAMIERKVDIHAGAAHRNVGLAL